jgi:hypothetical protein
MHKRPGAAPILAAITAVAALLAVLLGGVAIRTAQALTRLERPDLVPPRAAPGGSRRPTGAACC